MSLSTSPTATQLELASAWNVDRHQALSTIDATLADVVRAIGFEPDGTEPGPASAMPKARLLRSDDVLMREGQRAHALYVVRSGSFKFQRFLEDGYEQVLGFTGPGDVLAFESLHRGVCTMGATALEDAAVWVLPSQHILQARCMSPALDHALQVALSRQLARSMEIAQMMAAVSAEVRVARFLMSVSDRAAERGLSTKKFRLSMCRRDIASLLGVAHETVSRAFTTLSERGLLRVNNREVEIRSLDGLRAAARVTRGLGEEPVPSMRRQRPRGVRQTPGQAAFASDGNGRSQATA